MRSPQAGLTSDSGRFQPGTLRPVRELPEKRSGKTGAFWALRTGTKLGGVGVFDLVLLLVEIASALVVAWLVGQYIYTVYFDTTPHRVAASHAIMPSAGITRPTRTVTLTPAALQTAVPSLQSTAAVDESNVEVWDTKRKSYTRGDITGILSALTPTATVTATPTPTAIATVDPALLLPKRLRIPVMFLDSPIHEVKINMGTWEVSPMDIGHHEGTANPGEVGNLVLAGHRDINSALFRELDRLKPGDEVFVSNSFREYKYVVTDSFVVSPTQTEVMDPTDDKRVTLITCTPIGLATQRLIVTAILEQ